MRILTGYMPATQGKAVVAGFDVFDQPIEAKRRTGYLPETPPLYPDMTVKEYLDFVSKVKGVAVAGRRERIRQVMERVESPTWRIGSARSCRRGTGSASAWRRPSSTIRRLNLDEPTAGLDQQIIETGKLIKEGPAITPSS